MKLQQILEQQSSKVFVTNIEEDTVENEDFRRVLFTTPHSQLVLMAIRPGDDIGKEVHDNLDQFIRIDKGQGKLVTNAEEHQLNDGSAMVIPAGTEHNVINTSDDQDLKLYTVYTPPQHEKDVVHKTKEQAKQDDEHFTGQTDLE